MTDLITRLREAKEGSRELDADIAAFLHLAPPGFQVCNSGASYQKYNSTTDTVSFWSPPPVTTDLSAAVVLAERVLPGWEYGLHSTGLAWLWSPADVNAEEATVKIDEAPTPALALCVAILTAKEKADK